MNINGNITLNISSDFVYCMLQTTYLFSDFEINLTSRYIIYCFQLKPYFNVIYAN
jgi:hypothetical protein